jgi:hypothetical protein
MKEVDKEIEEERKNVGTKDWLSSTFINKNSY